MGRPDMSKNVIRHLGEILVCLVEEATTIPAGVMDCIIGQFTEFANVRVSLVYFGIADLTETGNPIISADCGCMQQDRRKIG